MAAIEKPTFASMPGSVADRELPDCAAANAAAERRGRSASCPAGPGSVSTGHCFAGEITGSGPLWIDGRFEGAIRLPDGCVTIGCNGHVVAGILAREVVIYGSVHGDVTASDGVEVFPGGSLTGDIAAAWIQMAEGACFKGRIETARPGQESAFPAETAAEPEAEVELVSIG